MERNEITPDEKDWTWVLEHPCPECGFEAGETAPESVAGLIRANGEDFAELLTGDPVSLRARTRPDRWSPLEYSAHVRDVYRLYLERLVLMLEQDNPLYPNWDQDVTAIEQRYNEQDPAVVAVELGNAAAAIAEAFESVSGDAWHRRGQRGDGASFTVDTFARYLIHDPVHHLWDVRNG